MPHEDIFSACLRPTGFKISTSELFDKFKEDNKHKITEEVRVERVSENFVDDNSGVKIPAYALSFVKVVRPQKDEVNWEDLNKAWSWEKRNWDDLLDARNWGRGTVEEEVTLQAEVNDHSCSRFGNEMLDQARESMATELPGIHSTSAFGGSIEEMTMTMNVNNPSSTIRRIFSLGIPCCSPSDQQAAAAGGTLFPCGQNLHNSVVHAPISNNISPSLPPHPSLDNQQHCLEALYNNNVNPHDQAGIDLHYLLASFGPGVPCYSPPDRRAAAAAGTLFHCDQNLSYSVVHAPISNNIFPILPPCPSHDNQLHCLNNNDVNPHDQPETEIDNDFVNPLHPSSLEKDIHDQQGISKQHLSDPFQKDIQPLEQQKPFEEGGSEAVQSVQRDERQNKELEGFKLPVGKEAARTEITPRTAEERGPDSDILKEILREVAKLNKEVRAVTTKVEISLRGQQNGTHYNYSRESTSSTGRIDFFTKPNENPHNDQNRIAGGSRVSGNSKRARLS
ncbi:hypothetical protein FEM48_Zijuj02G0049300 [Ziziphus jujuba var. spinosa]|uniref:Uncharacterized protein n=1 Tax=Ziziphus jujuba var. spinosa TaxID=714518 RepID=A0A978VTR6_ZIZJJ|nr:hypothetical protein FEM48_Zijuj02G0049300 [Ziziphus jujuba var. spinosa]